MRVTIVEWGGGNLGSVVRALRRLGAEVEQASDAAALEHAERLVLPGVGAFGAVMEGLDERGLREPLLRVIREGERPFLGICVGLQVLFEGSDESPAARGLGVIGDRVRRLVARKVPHVGWNEVVPRGGEDVLAPGHAYFVNSYAAPAPDGAEWVAARTDHEGAFASAVRVGRTLAVQFHPEKSAAYGRALLERWLGTC